MRVILFGAGMDGENALNSIGKDNVICFIDNYRKNPICGIPVYTLEEAIDNIDLDEIPVLITSSKYEKDMRKQCRDNKVPWFFTYYPMDHMKRSINERLSKDEWEGLHLSEGSLVKDKILNGDVSEWTKEMMRLTKPGDTILEIGCGTGETSLWLAQNGRIVTALDYSGDTIGMVSRIAMDLGIKLNTVCCDATKDLQLSECFDYVFQAGLLEHFYATQRIDMLRKWKKNARTMISLIPNANSIGYMIGKKYREENGTWEFGLEMPQKSLRNEFEEAGIRVIDEYTVDSIDSVRFLPEDNYLRLALEKLMEQYNLDEFGQGYLLVTIGTCV